MMGIIRKVGQFFSNIMKNVESIFQEEVQVYSPMFQKSTPKPASHWAEVAKEIAEERAAEEQRKEVVMEAARVSHFEQRRRERTKESLSFSSVQSWKENNRLVDEYFRKGRVTTN